MQLRVNGEIRTVPEGTTVATLLDLLAIRHERVAVEVNLEVVRMNARAGWMLSEGDEVEVVSFVGGGR